MKTVTKIFLLCSILTPLAGCGDLLHVFRDKHHENPYKPLDPTPPDDKKKPKRDCSLDDTNAIPADAPQSIYTIHLETDAQMVVRKNCDGTSSKEMETVKDADDTVVFESQNISDGTNIGDYNVYNRTVCESERGSPNNIFSIDHHKVSLIVGLRSHFLENNLKVHEGRNIISYTLYDNCPLFQSCDTKADKPELEKGFWILDVTHSAVNLPGEQVIEASGCKTP